MKKIALFICIAMCLTSLLGISAFASSSGITMNPDITVAKATPTIDGTISSGEGWTGGAALNEATSGYYWGANTWKAPTINLYYAFDDSGIYFAADITELGEYTYFSEYLNEDATDYDGYVASTGLDDIDSQADGTKHGFNGDTFIFAIDPLMTCYDEGLTTNEDYTAWYCVSMVNGEAKMYRTQVNEGYVDDGKVAGQIATTTDSKGAPTGWSFEAYIPWDTIVKDFNDITFDEFKDTITSATLTAEGAKSWVGAYYIDRFYDEEAEANDTRARYGVVKEDVCGIPGTQSDGMSVKNYGIKLINGAGGAVATTAADGTTAAGNNSGNNVATTTASANTGKSTNSSSSQTFDAGIALAIGGVLASGIGVASFKKKRK